MKKTYDELLNDFKADCKVVDLDKEYPNRVGKEKYLIITNADRSTFETKYNQILNSLEPYCIVGSYYLDIIRKYKANDSKHEKREKRNGLQYSTDEIAENHYAELQSSDCADVFFTMEMMKALYTALAQLSTVQKNRIFKRFWYNKKLCEIAEEESKSISSIVTSINDAEKAMKKQIQSIMNAETK